MMEQNNPMSALWLVLKPSIAKLVRETVAELLAEYQATKPEPEDEYLDAKKSADFIGESLSSFYRRTSQRDIPFYKRGKRVFCKRSELIAWIEEGKK